MSHIITPLLLPCTTKDASNIHHNNNLHPLGKLLRGRRFAQAALGMSIGLAISTAWFRYDVLSPHIVSVIVSVVLSAASVVVWNVRFVGRVLPGVVVAAERAALAALMFPFFAVVDAFLNNDKGGFVVWVPWGSLVWTVMIVACIRVAPPRVVTVKAWVR